MFIVSLCGCRCAVQGSADPLNSAFHLTYNMVLNLLRVEEINPEYMLEKSFYQFQHYRALPGVVESENFSLFTTAQSRLEEKETFTLDSHHTVISAFVISVYFRSHKLCDYTILNY